MGGGGHFAMLQSNLRLRTFKFACATVRLCRRLAASPGIPRQMSAQMLRSGTSVGANLEEAKSAHTRREFACKLGIALREARETHYWLRLMQASEVASGPDVNALIDEANELVAILTVSVRRARQPQSS